MVLCFKQLRSNPDKLGHSEKDLHQRSILTFFRLQQKVSLEFRSEISALFKSWQPEIIKVVASGKTWTCRTFATTASSATTTKATG